MRAGTDSNVSIVVNGVHEGKPTTSGSHKLDNSANNFERNMVSSRSDDSLLRSHYFPTVMTDYAMMLLQTDTFYLTCKNLGTLENIQIASDGRGLGAAWHLDHVEVLLERPMLTSCMPWLTPLNGLAPKPQLPAQVWNMNTGECTVFSCGEWLTPKDPMSLQKVG